eukprot:360343-Chlamydomonas_euryale.AAC.2
MAQQLGRVKSPSEMQGVDPSFSSVTIYNIILNMPMFYAAAIILNMPMFYAAAVYQSWSPSGSQGWNPMAGRAAVPQPQQLSNGSATCSWTVSCTADSLATLRLALTACQARALLRCCCHDAAMRSQAHERRQTTSRRARPGSSPSAWGRAA